MRRRVFVAVAALAAMVAACNVLSGADGLTARPPSPPSEADAADTADGAPSDTSVTPPPPPPVIPDSGDGGFDGESGADAGPPTFFDDFERTDGPLGNGWIEKTTGRFAIVNGAAQQGQGGPFRNLFASRPASEDALDVLVQATVTYAVDGADPTVFARIQPSSSMPDVMAAYLVYPYPPPGKSQSTALYLSRVLSDGSVTNLGGGATTFSKALVVGEPYQLSLQVTGTNPVHVIGSLSKPDGTVLATITDDDATGQRIALAGSVGFGSAYSVNGRWDDFKRITLP